MQRQKRMASESPKGSPAKGHGAGDAYMRVLRDFNRAQKVLEMGRAAVRKTTEKLEKTQNRSRK